MLNFHGQICLSQGKSFWGRKKRYGDANAHAQPQENSRHSKLLCFLPLPNPPFNAKSVDKERLESDKRFALGLPNTDNANYIWIQQFYSALNATDRAGFVMTNSAGDARSSEQLIRQKLIESKDIVKNNEINDFRMLRCILIPQKTS